MNKRTCSHKRSAAYIAGALFTATILVSSCGTDTTGSLFDGRSKSRSLREVERRFKPEPINKKHDGARVMGLGDIFKFISDVADVVFSDVEGFLAGASAGAAAGAVVYNPEDPDYAEKVRAASIAGGVVYGAVSSIKEVKEKTSDSLVVPESSPYNSGTKPNSPDSVGWLHNQAVLFVHNSRVNSPSTTVRALIRQWAVTQRGYDSVFIDTLLTQQRYDDVLDAVDATTTHAAFIQSLSNSGLNVEASVLDSLYSELVYLENQNYTTAAAVSLIQGYKTDVQSLSISQARKDDFVRLLAVYEYCVVLYNDNEDYW